MNMINPIFITYSNYSARFVTSDVIATARKYLDLFATKEKLILFEHILSSMSVNNSVIVIENRQKFFELRLQSNISTFENVQLQLQQHRVINHNFVNYNYNFSKPATGIDFSI